MDSIATHNNDTYKTQIQRSFPRHSVVHIMHIKAEHQRGKAQPGEQHQHVVAPIGRAHRAPGRTDRDSGTSRHLGRDLALLRSDPEDFREPLQQRNTRHGRHSGRAGHDVVQLIGDQVPATTPRQDLARPIQCNVLQHGLELELGRVDQHRLVQIERVRDRDRINIPLPVERLTPLIATLATLLGPPLDRELLDKVTALQVVVLIVMIILSSNLLPPPFPAEHDHLGQRKLLPIEHRHRVDVDPLNGRPILVLTEPVVRSTARLGTTVRVAVHAAQPAVLVEARDQLAHVRNFVRPRRGPQTDRFATSRAEPGGAAILGPRTARVGVVQAGDFVDRRVGGAGDLGLYSRARVGMVP